MGFRGILYLLEAQRMRGSREEQVRMVIDRDRWMAEAIRSESRAAGRRPALRKHAEKGRNAGALFRIVGKHVRDLLRRRTFINSTTGNRENDRQIYYSVKHQRRSA